MIKQQVAAAVVLIVARSLHGEESVLLTRRALGLREHPGEVALPGGKSEPEDTSWYRTALRECEEEVGLREFDLRYRAELPLHFTRRGMGVIPFVVELVGEPELHLCKDEIESALWVPIKLFVDDKRSFTHIFELDGQVYWAPVYQYQQYNIWGLTARILVTFVNAFYGAQIARQHDSAEEKYRN